MANTKVYSGRTKIYTSMEATGENIPQILNNALEIHSINSSECDYLINYALGTQPILNRVKTIRSEIKNNTVFNHAYSSIRTIVGYTFGQPIQYTLRTTNKQESIKKLNDYMDYESSHAIDTDIAWFSSICGIGYKGIFPDGDNVPFEVLSLDPRNTFVVLDTNIGDKQVLSCSYVTELDDQGNDKSIIYTVYTDKFEYKYKTTIGNSIGTESLVPGYPKPNILNINPIRAYYNNQFLIGDFETALSVLDAINTVGSNSIDDIEQIVQSILVVLGIGVEQQDQIAELSTGSALILPGNQGVNQDAKFINSALDSTTIKDLREYLEETARAIIGIPERKTRGGGGGDTGDAVKLRDGWADLEIVARNKEMFWKKSEKKSLQVILNILHIKNLCKDLEPIDIDIKFTRNKNDNLITKTQAMATMYNMNMDKQDILAAGEITTDNIEVVKRWIAEEEARLERANKNTIITESSQTSV